MEGSGREEPDIEDVAGGCFIRNMRKLIKNRGRRIPSYPSPTLKIRVNRPLASGSQSLRLGEILRVHIKVIIGPAKRTAGRRGELRGGVVDFVFLDLWWHCGLGGRPSLPLPQAQVLEDLFYLPAIALDTLSPD
ncbi:MAG: hypothetical protein HQ561_08625 [Desulfobacteraceae bacterium]|nr:hypothetical protein [Desulfobacteraceae bacterium]